MNSRSLSKVVVGVDGSAPALDAVRLAAQEAALHGRRLQVVHAFTWPLVHAPLGPSPLLGMGVPLGPSPIGPEQGGLRHQAEQIVAEAVAEAEKTVPEVAVTGDVFDGAPAAVLLDAARDAALVVLGNRGLGGFGGLLLGSTALQVSAHAECPVLVARGEPRAAGPVVVGVDGSTLSEKAIGFAFAEADRRGTELVAVHAWLHPVPIGPGDVLPLVYDLDTLGDNEERLLAESLAGWSARFPDVRVRKHLVRGAAARVLVEESASAQLMVVGARGRGGFAGLLLGSVSQALLHHAQCPLALIRRDSGLDQAGVSG